MYHTLDELKRQAGGESVLIQLADDTGSGSLDAAALLNVDAAVSKAKAIIDGYITDRYPMPLSEPVPDVIREVSLSLTVYFLFHRRLGANGDMSKEMTRTYDNAINLLEHIQGGKISLYKDQEESVVIRVSKNENDRIFTDSLLGKY